MLDIPIPGRPPLGRTSLGMCRRREYAAHCSLTFSNEPHGVLAMATVSMRSSTQLWRTQKRLADVRRKRIILLGPSHHYYLTKAALSRCTHYSTPLGDLAVDREAAAELYKTGQFEWMSQSVDEDEHSLEMHLPYIYKILSTFVVVALLEWHAQTCRLHVAGHLKQIRQRCPLSYQSWSEIHLRRRSVHSVRSLPLTWRIPPMPLSSHPTLLIGVRDFDTRTTGPRADLQSSWAHQDERQRNPRFMNPSKLSTSNAWGPVRVGVMRPGLARSEKLETPSAAVIPSE